MLSRSWSRSVFDPVIPAEKLPVHRFLFGLAFFENITPILLSYIDELGIEVLLNKDTVALASLGSDITKSAINKIKEPNNKYLLISEKPAWEALNRWKNISQEFAHYSFRNACGFTAHPNEIPFKTSSPSI